VHKRVQRRDQYKSCHGSREGQDESVRREASSATDTSDGGDRGTCGSLDGVQWLVGSGGAHGESGVELLLLEVP
jgi:hypothetical protein